MNRFRRIEQRIHEWLDCHNFTVHAKWRFMEPFNIAYIDTGEVFLKRWTIVGCPWFSIKLHQHIGPDERRNHLHDHPWDFTALVLWGGYSEVVFVGEELMDGRSNIDVINYPDVKYRKIGWLERNRKKATDYHRITSIEPNTWTLLWCGPKKRVWGFRLNPEEFAKLSSRFRQQHSSHNWPKNWVPHNVYHGIIESGVLETEEGHK